LVTPVRNCVFISRVSPCPRYLQVSSRAHTIFKIQLSQTQLFRDTGKATDRVAVINLIDLAGSERAESTGATGDRLKEGCAINQVLLCVRLRT
jgi:hypothetical protein